jgi:hypothetical protein
MVSKSLLGLGTHLVGSRRCRWYFITALFVAYGSQDEFRSCLQNRISIQMCERINGTRESLVTVHLLEGCPASSTFPGLGPPCASTIDTAFVVAEHPCMHIQIIGTTEPCHRSGIVWLPRKCCVYNSERATFSLVRMG